MDPKTCIPLCLRAIFGSDLLLCSPVILLRVLRLSCDHVKRELQRRSVTNIPRKKKTKGVLTEEINSWTAGCRPILLWRTWPLRLEVVIKSGGKGGRI